MPNTVQPKNQRLTEAALYGAALLLPGLFALYLALTASPISVRDYWSIMGWVYGSEGFSTNLSDWFVPQNGHIVFLPRLIYALNIVLTGGSNIGLTVIAWLLALMQALLLASFIPPAIRDRRVRLAALLIISGFSFAPSATDNWMHGFSGVHWLLANIFSISAILCLSKFFQEGGYRWVGGSLLLAGLGLITYGTATIVWASLLAAFVFSRSHWRLGVLLLAATGLTVAIALYSRPLMPESSVTTLDRAIIFGPYLAIFMGGVFTTNIPLAFGIGLIGLGIGAALTVAYGFLAAAPVRLMLLPWLMLLIYSLANAALIALTRLEFGLGYATTQRYVTISGLFWIWLLVMLGYWGYHQKERYSLAALTPYLIAASLLFLAMLPLAQTRIERWRHQISLQPLAVLSVELGIPDQRVVEVSITDSAYAFLRQVPALKANDLVPFDNPDAGLCHQPGQPLPDNIIDGADQGRFEFLDPVTADGYRAIGRLAIDPATVDCLVLADPDNIVRGLALPGFRRPDLGDSQLTGWVGYVRPTAPTQQLTAYMRQVGNNGWLKLADSRSPQNPGPVNPAVYVDMVGSPFDEHPGLDSFNAMLQTLGYTPPAVDLTQEAN